jgi:hypothetical protein
MTGERDLNAWWWHGRAQNTHAAGREIDNLAKIALKQFLWQSSMPSPGFARTAKMLVLAVGSVEAHVNSIVQAVNAIDQKLRFG